MKKITYDNVGRVIFHGNEVNGTSYMYDENGIVSQEVYTEYCEKNNKVIVSTWTYDGKHLYVPHHILHNGVHIRTETRKADASWWENNMTAEKIACDFNEAEQKKKLHESIWKAHWQNAMDAKSTEALRNLLEPHQQCFDGTYDKQGWGSPLPADKSEERINIIKYISEKLRQIE